MAQIQIRCPVCKKIFQIDKDSSNELVQCPNCNTQAKLPVSATQIDSPTVYITSKFETLQYILAICEKDIKSSMGYLYILFIVGIIFIPILTFPMAADMAASKKQQQTDYETYDYDNETSYKDILREQELSDITTIYGVSVFVNMIIVMVVSNALYGKEIKKGTIRLLSLYSIDMNILSISKILSISIISGICLIAIFFIPGLSFMAFGLFPWLPTTTSIAYFTTVLILIAASFASHIWSYFTKNVVLALNRVTAIFVILSFLLTQNILFLLQVFSIQLKGIYGTEYADAIAEAEETAINTSVFSPYHCGGRIANDIIGLNTGSYDLQVVFLIFIALVFFGYTLGKKIYLDVFIKD